MGVNSRCQGTMHSPPSLPLPLRICFFRSGPADSTPLLYLQVGSSPPHQPEFLLVRPCMSLGGRSDQTCTDQSAAFKVGIKEQGPPTPRLCLPSSLYLSALNWGRGRGGGSIISHLASGVCVQCLARENTQEMMAGWLSEAILTSPI